MAYIGFMVFSGLHPPWQLDAAFLLPFEALSKPKRHLMGFGFRV